MASGGIQDAGGVVFAHTVFGFCFLYLSNTVLNSRVYKSGMPPSGKSKDMITRAPLPRLPKQHWKEPRASDRPGYHLTLLPVRLSLLSLAVSVSIGEEMRDRKLEAFCSEEGEAAEEGWS